MSDVRTQREVVQAVIRRSTLSDAAKAVLKALIASAAGRAECHPKLKNVIRRVGMSRLAVLEAIQELVETGWIRFERIPGADREQWSYIPLAEVFDGHW